MYIRNLKTGHVHDVDTLYGLASHTLEDGTPMYEKITKKEFEAAEREADIAYFRELFPVGARVATSVVHVARSGMSRSIKVFAVIDGSICDVSWRVARLLRQPFDNNKGGVKVSGCGMDMTFATVYNLGRTLYPEGFPVPGTGRNGDTSGHDNDGGYALKNYNI